MDSGVAGFSDIGFLLEDAGLERVSGPDRQRPRLSGLGIETMPVRGSGVIMAFHPLPAAHEIRTVIIKAYELKFPTPCTLLRISPADHRFLTMWTYRWHYSGFPSVGKRGPCGVAQAPFAGRITSPVPENR